MKTLSLSLVASLGLCSCDASLSGSGIEVGSGANLTCVEAPYPVLLHHGFGGSDGNTSEGYFVGVAPALRARGEIVYETVVAPYQSSEYRGTQLSSEIDQILEETGACKVNIIAHSQGGLDVRYAIGSLGYGDVIASVVTMSTPHRGSPLADMALGIANGWTTGAANAFFSWWGVSSEDIANNPDIREALRSLSTTNADAFAAQNPDDPRVAVYSVAGRTLGYSAESACADGLWPNPEEDDAADYLITAPAFLLLRNPFWPVYNDGFVTVASAKWGTFLGCVPADHWDQRGRFDDSLLYPEDKADWWDTVGFYTGLVDFLHSQGF